MKGIPKDIERKLQVALRHIEESAAFDGICGMDFNEATSVSSLAAASGLSERSLRDYFKTYTGLTLVKYVSSRRAEYAGRILRLFPTVSKSQVSYSLGFNFPNGIYGLMRKNGVSDIDSWRDDTLATDMTLPFRKEYLSDCVLFYSQLRTDYNVCASTEFESEHWDQIEEYIKAKYADSQIIGYVGFAIDRYIENDSESGTFISGILFQGIKPSALDKDMIGEIGWRIVPSHRYAIFTHVGSYEGLSTFYDEVIATINGDRLKVDITTPFMEKYLNSPTDTQAEELITELWVALAD